MQLLEFCSTGFVTRKFDEVAAREELAQTILLGWRQQISCLQFKQKLLGGAVWCMEIESFLKINADGIGNQNAKQSRLIHQRQRSLQFFPGANVRRHDDDG